MSSTVAFARHVVAALAGALAFTPLGCTESHRAGDPSLPPRAAASANESPGVATPTEPRATRDADPAPLPPPVSADGFWSVARLVAESPSPDRVVRVAGVLASFRRCPECPPNVACKPCDSFLHLTDGPSAPAGEGLFVRMQPDPSPLTPGHRYAVVGSGYSVVEGLRVPDLTRGPSPISVAVRARLTSTSHRELPKP